MIPGLGAPHDMAATTFDLVYAGEAGLHDICLPCYEGGCPGGLFRYEEHLQGLEFGPPVFGQAILRLIIVIVETLEPYQLRGAMLYAIDQNLIRDTLYGGPDGMFRTDGWLHVTPSTLGWSPEIVPFPYNPQRAQDLLADAGYPGGAGFPDDLKVITYEAPEWPFLPEMSIMVADMLEDNLNIPVEVVVGEYGSIVADIEAGTVGNHIFMRVNDTRWDGGSVAACCYMEPFAWHTRGVDPRIDAAGREALAELDPAKRQAAYNEFYKVIHDEQYAFGLGYINLPYGVSARIFGWEPWAVNSYPNALWTIVVND